ncbi:hypothetical protein [Streptomyces cinerochromogenes]|uniref:hypothetical protein n=1 Tax=Streptomyces cinerochromogenes TaxID=66422 RepID=UPI00166FC7E8|nr:hypothetical protein [Streptomyces cinerochromogenes]GGT00046.1 hypothetical protein GCM10010206_73420 [Streptomyces cinerochromogenes]
MTPYSTTTTPASTTPASTAPAGTTAPARFLLLGDSHAGPVGRAAQEAGIPFRGGPIGAGRDFFAEFFDVRAGDRDEGGAGDDIVFRKPEADRHYRRFLDELGIPALGALTVPLVSTLGFSAHFVATAENWQVYRVRDGFPPGFLSGRLFDGVVLSMSRGALAFYRHVRRLGLRTLAVMPPQRVPGHADPEVFRAAQDTLRRALLPLGVEIVDLRERATDSTGVQRPELCEPDDTIHGNLAFGRMILADLLARGL